MRLHLSHGINSLDDIRESYNTYDGGGSTNKFPWELNPNSPENREETQQYLSRQQERINAKENEINNPSVGRLAGEALGTPYRWMANPQNIVGDITGYNIGPNSQQDILSARRNNVYGRNNLQEAVTMFPSALYNSASVIGGAAMTAQMLAGNYMASSPAMEGIGTLAGTSMGIPNNTFINKLSEKQKRAGALTDIKQAIQNVREEDWKNAALNSVTGVSGLWDTTRYTGPLGVTGKVIDFGLERLNDYTDAKGVAGAFNYNIDNLPKDAIAKSKKLYAEYKRKQEIDRQRAESARKNKEATDRRDSLERIKKNNIIVPSKENDYMMYKPKNQLPEIIVIGRKKY